MCWVVYWIAAQAQWGSNASEGPQRHAQRMHADAGRAGQVHDPDRACRLVPCSVLLTLVRPSRSAIETHPYPWLPLALVAFRRSVEMLASTRRCAMRSPLVPAHVATARRKVRAQTPRAYGRSAPRSAVGSTGDCDAAQAPKRRRVACCAWQDSWCSMHRQRHGVGMALALTVCLARAADASCIHHQHQWVCGRRN